MICINFSGDYIDVVVTTGSKKNLSVESGGSLKTPSNVISANGEVNFAVLEDCLRPKLEQIGERKVVISFSFLPTIYSVLNLHKERNKHQQRMAVESQVYANISPQDYYVDYFTADSKVNEEGKHTFISYAMPKKVVDGTFKMLQNLGKVPTALVPSQYAAECFIDNYFKDETVALARLGEKSVTLHLLNPPDNMITRDTVIDSASGSLDVLANISTSVNPKDVFVQNIEKLNSYQNIKFPGQPIDKVLVHGHYASQDLVTLVNTSLGLPSELLSNINEDFAQCPPVYTLGANLSLGNKEINFFNRITTEKTVKKTSSTKINIPLIVACVIVIINVAFLGVLISLNIQSENLIKERQDMLQSPETQQLIEEYGNLRNDFVSKLKSEEFVSSLAGQLEAEGEFEREILNQITSLSPSGVTVQSVSYSSRTYNLVCNGQTEQQASDYVQILTNQGLFSYVGYFGYSESGEMVTFTITCRM